METEGTASATNRPATADEVHDDDEEEEEEEVMDDKNLLALRQKYKKTSSNLTKIQSHLNFISACIERGHTPKGLQIPTRCNALLADLTSVKTRFKHTRLKAERDLHGSLHLELKTIQDAMDRRLEDIHEDAPRLRHLLMMEKTTSKPQKSGGKTGGKEEEEALLLRNPPDDHKERW